MIIQGIAIGREISTNPQDAIDILKSVPTPLRKYAEPEVLLNAQGIYPQQTLNYLLSSDCQIEPDKNLIHSICSAYFLQNPEMFSQQVADAPPGLLRDKVIAFMVVNLALTDMESARIWANNVQSNETRDKLLNSLSK